MSTHTDPQAAADLSDAIAFYGTDSPAVADMLRSAAAAGSARAFSIRLENGVLVCWLVCGNLLILSEVAAEAGLTIAIPLTRVRRVQESHTTTGSSLLLEVDADALRLAGSSAPVADGHTEHVAMITAASYAWNVRADDQGSVSAMRNFASQLRAAIAA